jgi:hypothetical protein
MIKIIILIVSALFMQSCTNYLTVPSGDVMRATTVSKTDFDKSVKVAGPIINVIQKPNFFTTDSVAYLLRGWHDPQIGEVHQLYAEIDYDSSTWRFYQSADLKGGQSARFASLDRHVRRCSAGGLLRQCNFVETIAVEFDRDFLQKHKDAGFEIRFNARSGDTNIILMSGSYIAGYLAATGPSFSEGGIK